MVSGGHLAINLAEHPCRRDRDRVGLATGRVGVAHPCEKLCQVDALQLDRTSPGNLLIQVLSRSTERLFELFGLPLEPPAVRSADRRGKLLVKLVANRCDVR